MRKRHAEIQSRLAGFFGIIEDEEQTLDPQLLKILGYDLAEFDEIPGRFFCTTRGQLIEIM